MVELDADFRGAADPDGNVYWTEYDPSLSYPPPPQAGWLVSAGADGAVRYRVPAPAASSRGVFVIASGRVLMSRGAVIAAHDGSTGAALWSLDFRAVFGTDPTFVWSVGSADLGDGVFAFALYTDTGGERSGFYLVDVASGDVVASSVSPGAAGYAVEGSDGAGDVLVSAFPSFAPNPSRWVYSSDVIQLDGAGRQAWNSRIGDLGPPPFLLAWSSAGPVLRIDEAQTIFGRDQYLAAPSGWAAVVMGLDAPTHAPVPGFALDAATNPLTVHVLRGEVEVAKGPLAGADTLRGVVAAWPFLAGEHLVLLAQTFRPHPSLCHLYEPVTASVSRFDAQSSYECPLAFPVEAEILGVALLPGEIVIARRPFDGACTTAVQPTTFEAYALPGESLAPAGWVQREGNPGLGMRPVTR